MSRGPRDPATAPNRRQRTARTPQERVLRVRQTRGPSGDSPRAQGPLTARIMQRTILPKTGLSRPPRARRCSQAASAHCSGAAGTRATRAPHARTFGSRAEGAGASHGEDHAKNDTPENGTGSAPGRPPLPPIVPAALEQCTNALVVRRMSAGTPSRTAKLSRASETAVTCLSTRSTKETVCEASAEY